MKPSPISVRILYYMTILAYWLMLGVVVIVFILNILLLISDGFGKDFQLTIQFPMTFSVTEPGAVDIFGESNEIRITDAIGMVKIIDTPEKFSTVIIRVALLVVLIGLFIVWKFKLFIPAIKNSRVFLDNNINYLKHIAYGILGLWLVTQVYLAVLYHWVFKFSHFKSVILDNQVNYSYELLFVALLVWVLAHVFMKGAEMQKEQELTI